MGMNKHSHNRVVYKPYVMGQPSLLPPSLEELIPEDHVVRTVHTAIEQLDLSILYQQYRGGGTSSYHPKMMLKVLVYSYVEKLYSSRRIAKALRENVNFMWLSGQNRPDFRTINRFRGEVMKEIIGEVFASVLELLIEQKHVTLEDYFVDGSKLEANANRYSAVWAKNTQRYKEGVKQKIRELLEEIEAVNEIEQEEYGDQDLPEVGEEAEIDSREAKEIEMNLRKETETALANRANAEVRYPVGTKMAMPNGCTAEVVKAEGVNRTLSVEDQSGDVTVYWMQDSINIDGCTIVE